MKFILASNSPRRRDILYNYLEEIKVISQEIDEKIDCKYDLIINSMSISRKKGKKIALEYPDYTILSGDTIVVLDGEVLLKPRNRDEAKTYLKKLSGRTNYVISSFFISNKRLNLDICDYDISKVRFHELTNKIIDDYLKTGEWIDKAGAYGIQGAGSLLIDYIYGDFYSIVGLPIAKINQYLIKYFDFSFMEAKYDLQNNQRST